MEIQEIRQLFHNAFDAYISEVDEDVPAMTEDRFVQVILQLLADNK